MKITKALVSANKFYVGSSKALLQRWGHPTQDEAVKHAEEILVEQDGQDQFIVKIVAVVRRKPQPAVVERVK